jgi:hypothetical protein
MHVMPLFDPGTMSMELAIIGIYESRANAYSAKHELLASGFPRGKVQLNPDNESSASADSSNRDGKTANDSGIGGIFRSLLYVGNKSSYSNVYADAVRRGEYVVIAEVSDETERARAMDIMNQYGPAEMEERSAAWMHEGWRGHNPEKRS